MKIDTRRRFVQSLVVLVTLIVAGLGTERLIGGQAGNQAPTRFEIRLAESEPAAGLVPAPIAGSQRQVYRHPDSIVTNLDVVEARPFPVFGGASYSIAVTFSQAGANRMLQAMSIHVDRPMAILLNGQVVSTSPGPFSKKIENHAAAVALYFMYYNFWRVHQTLRVIPAMEAGIANQVWSYEEIVGLLE